MNLSYCLLSLHETSLTVLEWEVLDVSSQKNEPLDSLRENIMRALDTHPSLPAFLSCDAVLIENQPTFKNPKMKAVAGCIHDFFILRGKRDAGNAEMRILAVSPVSKVKGETYLQKKKRAVELCRGLTESCSEAACSSFRTRRKKDDLADSFLLAFQYLSKKMNVPVDTVR